MKLSAVSGITLTLLLIGMLTLTLNIQQAHSSEPPPIEWCRTYEGVGHALVETSDDGYAWIGRKGNFIEDVYVDSLLVKVDSSGNMQWNKTYRRNIWNVACSLVETSEGGYAFAGYTGEYSSYGFWLVKTDSCGNMQWSKEYGKDVFNAAFSLVETSDSGYVIAGNSGNPEGEDRSWLIKVDSSGNIEWNQTYLGINEFSARSMVQTDDGGYALAGITDSFGGGWTDFLLVKTDSYGNMEWNQTYGGPSDDYAYSMVQTDDGGYALAGTTYSVETIYSDLWLVKTDSYGNMEWNQTYGETGGDSAHCVVQTGESGYAIAGCGFANLVKTDSNGNLLWSKNYGGDLCFSSMVESSDGGYTLAGNKDGDFWLVKIGPLEYTVTFFTDPIGPGFNITYQEQTYSDGESDTFPYGTSGLVTANAPTGWELDHWELDGDDVGTDDPYTVVIDANHTLTAVYRAGAQVPITIYIRADGSVDPPYAPISSTDNVTYTFTSNITGSIVIERSNTIVDGDGYTLDAQDLDAITLSSINNVTIQNLTSINYGGCCINFFESSFNTVSGNNLLGEESIFVINLSDSPNNTICENNISSVYCERAISLSSSSFNNISENNIEGRHTLGVFLSFSSFNKLYGNNILLGYESRAISLSSSFFNNIFGNNIQGGYHDYVCVWVSSSSNNKFHHNNFIGNGAGVESMNSTNAWDDGYPSGGNYWSSYVGVDEYSGVNQDEPGHDGLGDTPYVIDQDNQDNYPFLRPCPQPPWIPISSFVYTPSAPVVDETVTFNASASYDVDGQIVSYAWDFGDQTNITETDTVTTHSYAFPGTYPVTLNITDNDGLTDVTTKSINIGKIHTSTSISTSSPSTFVGFRVNITGTLQDMYGNGLAGETVVLYYTFSGITTWTPITSDTTDSLGNYFAMWIPPATGYFVIKGEWAGNSTHFGANNTATLSSLVYQDQYVFSVESNSTISELAFNTKNWKLSFVATGPNGTRGYVKVTVAKSLVADIADIRVFLDGRQFNFSIVSLDDSWLLTFNYVHSTHQVEMDLDINIIPEFSSFLVILLFMIATLLTVLAYRRKPKWYLCQI